MEAVLADPVLVLGRNGDHIPDATLSVCVRVREGASRVGVRGARMRMRMRMRMRACACAACMVCACSVCVCADVRYAGQYDGELEEQRIERIVDAELHRPRHEYKNLT